MGDSLPGLQARLMSQALRKLTGTISKSKCMVIFINQIRMKIGVMFGNPETTTGGNALKFYSSVRLDIRRIGQIKEREEAVGNQTRVKIVKNKVAPPFKQVEFDIMYGEGISKTGELVDLGVKAGIVEKSGAWISYNGTRIGQGRENAKTFLKDNPKIAAELEAAIRQNAGLIVDQMLLAPTEQADPDPDGLAEVPDADGVLPEADDPATTGKRARAGRCFQHGQSSFCRGRHGPRQRRAFGATATAAAGLPLGRILTSRPSAAKNLPSIRSSRGRARSVAIEDREVGIPTGEAAPPRV